MQSPRPMPSPASVAEKLARAGARLGAAQVLFNASIQARKGVRI